MDQGDGKRSANILQMVAAERRAVIHIKLSGNSPPGQSVFKSVQIGANPLRYIKTGMNNQSAVIVYDGDQVRLLFLSG
jgi:hypothetical protein